MLIGIVEENPGINNTYFTPLYSIGTVSRMLGVSVQTLRHYEREGLIAPYKSDSNHRQYSKADIDRLECIRRAINVDKMSIQGIKRIHALIPCWQIRNCPERDRMHCEAYQGHEKGCWNYNHTASICATEECRLCEVYQIATDCHRVKQTIIQTTNSPSNDLDV